MAGKKRVEAWGVVAAKKSIKSVRSAHSTQREAQEIADLWLGSIDYRVVRLTEVGPGEVVVPRSALAVVRAAVGWAHLALDRSTSGSPGRADAHDALVRAVEKYQGRKK